MKLTKKKTTLKHPLIYFVWRIPLNKLVCYLLLFMWSDVAAPFFCPFSALLAEESGRLGKSIVCSWTKPDEALLIVKVGYSV